ncbi:serine hydrolase [Herbivorax sp. ANBcel31]|uniref:serine hydrolase n=1 Tax=Herbivorax sp. ANBcel31 TaxID=3069754 RepID=UPI0027AE9E94|nr:serine hydrolase [Herbivorax sp. ANBcel31]MDQ2086961.1 serine hydrolase [Herbivorax sp. ANBcel31]
MSKKLTSILVTIALIMSFATFQVVAENHDIVVEIDGQVVKFPDAEPFIDEHSRTLCPVRFIAEDLGAEVLWNDEDRTVSIQKDNTDILLKIGDDTAMVNGVEKTFDTFPQIYEDRTYVPLRFISETLNMDVDWDDETKTVIISTPDELNELTMEEHFDRYLTAMKENRGFRGSVLVAHEGETLFSKGYGYANYEEGVKNTPNTMFAIGSVTKQFTAMAIMQLYEQELLELDDALSQYIPDVVEGDNITVKHLLTHTSGLFNYTNFLMEIEDVPEENTEDFLMDLFKDEPLIFETGTQWEYNNTGYLLLGLIVEEISGLSLGEYLKENIFDLLEMNDTGTYYDKKEEEFAIGYTGSTELTPVEQDEILLKIAYGAGNLFSTVNDMYKWDRALHTEKLVKEETLDMVFDVHENIPEEEMLNFGGFGYGYGWIISDDSELGKIVSHGGNTLSYSAQISKYLEQDITIIITTNIGYYVLDSIEATLIDIIMGNEYELPEELVEIELDAEILEQYTGIYENAEGYNIVIKKSDGQLYAQLPGQEKIEIYPISEIEFFYKEVNAFITFKKNDDGEAEKLIFEQEGIVLEGTRTGDVPQREIADIDKKIYEKYVGEYKTDDIGTFTISIEDESLYARLTGQVRLEISPMSQTEFFYKDIQAEIEFIIDDDGTMRGLILKQGGQNFLAEKI